MRAGRPIPECQCYSTVYQVSDLDYLFFIYLVLFLIFEMGLLGDIVTFAGVLTVMMEE